jgi:polar amino acid transport system permease protein
VDIGYHLTFGPVLQRWPVLLDGLWVSLLLTVVGVALGTALGIAGGLGRTSRHAWLRWALRGYVEVFRNTPLLVQLFLVFFGLPSLGIRLSPVVAACVTLVLNNAAYTTEIVRVGIAATPRGQVEAAMSLALKPWQILAFIVIPPALERIYPTLVSQNVLLMLSTSITSAIGVQELTGSAAAINADTFRSLEVFLTSAAIYLSLTYIQRAVLFAGELVLFPHRRART